MTDDLDTLIARAWAKERAQWIIVRNGQGLPPRLKRRHIRDDPGFKGTEADLQAHLDALCAAAVRTALAEAGYAVVKGSDDGL